MGRHAVKFHEPPFGKRPKGLDSVDMASATSELVLSVLHPKVLFVSEIDQAVISPPAIRMNDAVEADSSPNDGLQRGLCAIRDDFGVDPAISLEYAENRCLAGSAAASLAFDASAAEVGLVDLDFSHERGLVLAKLGNPRPDEVKIAIDGIAVETGEGSCLASVQIQGETPCQMPEFGL